MDTGFNSLDGVTKSDASLITNLQSIVKKFSFKEKLRLALNDLCELSVSMLCFGVFLESFIYIVKSQTQSQRYERYPCLIGDLQQMLASNGCKFLFTLYLVINE
ncbi:hypothetical protein BS333_19095 [Vibrio azureus]|nr:hypothetical protein BS333_19095 [Vibrio azureus]